MIVNPNKALIQTPDWVSDYVMIANAHLVHFDHSRDFWALVAKYTDYTKAAKKVAERAPSGVDLVKNTGIGRILVHWLEES